MQVAAAGWTTGLRAEQNSGERVGAHERTFPGRSPGVADWREVKLQVRAFEPGPRSHEATTLVNAETQRPAPPHEVGQSRTELTKERTQFLVECRNSRPVDVVDAQVILEVRP